MSWAFILQTLISALAIGGLIWLAAWARIAAPRPPLDAAAARALIAEEFPSARLDGVWVAADGKAALARAGDLALVVYLRGDDYVARSLAWRDLAQARVEDGAVAIFFHDIAAPAARLATDGAWPPALGATA